MVRSRNLVNLGQKNKCCLYVLGTVGGGSSHVDTAEYIEIQLGNNNMSLIQCYILSK